jgi:aminoglycoside 3-N-acetyltransferase
MKQAYGDSQTRPVAGSRTCLRYDALVEDLRRLGVRQGQNLLVHTSLQTLGWVEGGAASVVAALREVLGPHGTIVVPTSTADNSNSSRTHLAGVQGMSRRHRRDFLREMPPFNRELSPSTGMGAVAEHVRTSPGAVRSAHPQTSFAAIGPLARHFMDDHAMDCHLGERSPLARLHSVNAHILMLGVGYDSCTALHLAEYRYTMNPPTRRYRCVIERAGQATWWSYQDVVLDDRDFTALGKALDDTPYVVRGAVGAADSRLLPLAQTVDFAAEWLAVQRNP